MGCEEIQKLYSTDPLAEYRSTPLIRSVNVKDVLGDIQTDYDNFRHARLPQVVLNTLHLGTRAMHAASQTARFRFWPMLEDRRSSE
jgi:hypothetical protein